MNVHVVPCCSGAQLSCLVYTRIFFSENQAVVLHQGDKRLRSLVRVMKFRQTDANSHEFFASHPGYSMKDIAEPVESLCIEKHDPGASLDDNNMEFRCELIDQMGLGSTIDEEKIIIRVFGS